MPHFITYDTCPACRSQHIAPALQAKDYTVSGEVFAIWQCHRCTLRFTQHVPSAGSIGKYYQSGDYISHSDTKKGIVNQLYHTVRNITLAQKKALLQSVTGRQKGVLLDIGAGTGAFAHTMQKSHWQVTALEPDETARANAKQRYGINLQTPDYLFQLPSDCYHAITLWHVLEHVHDLHGYLSTFTRILQSSGRLIIAVPNYTSFDAAYYGEYWAAYDVPRHLYHFSPASLTQLLAQHQFGVIQYKPMPFDSFYVSMLSETYKNGKNNYPNAFITGARTNLKAAGKPHNSSSVIYIAEKK